MPLFIEHLCVFPMLYNPVLNNIAFLVGRPHLNVFGVMNMMKLVIENIDYE